MADPTPIELPTGTAGTGLISRAALLARMTPAEVHNWRRAAQRALDAQPTSVVAADRNALYAWTRFEAFDQFMELRGNDLQGLKSVWMALGMSSARADELLTP